MLTISYKKHILCALILHFYSLFSFGQNILIQSNFDHLEHWSGETFTTGKEASGWFEVNPEKQLQVNITGGSGQRYATVIHNAGLKYPEPRDTLIWKVSFLHDFSVSSSLQKKNNSRLILFQNSSHFSTSDTLIYLEISNTVKLVEDKSDNVVTIVEVESGILPSQWHHIEIQKSGDYWSIMLDDDLLIESSHANFSTGTYYTGLLSTFSASSRGQHFLYDDFVHLIKPKAIDSTPPKVLDTFLEGQDILKVEFSEFLSKNQECTGTVEIDNQLVDFFVNQDSLSLTINQHFEIDKTYVLHLGHFCDVEGNAMEDTVIDVYVQDQFPPVIDSLHIKNEFILDVFFNEAVELTDLSTIYLISKSDTISIIDTLAGNNELLRTVVLQKSLPSNKEFDLHIESLSDLKGNFQDVSFVAYYDTRSPKLLSFEIKNPYQITLLFDEAIATHFDDPFDYVVDGNQVPNEIEIVEQQIDLFFNEVSFQQDSSYKVYIKTVQDLFGNVMKSKTIELEYDTTKAQILNTFQNSTHNTILFDEKIVSIDSASHYYRNIDCPTSMIQVDGVPFIKLYGVKDENQNIMDSIDVSFNETLSVRNIFCSSDSTVRINTAHYIDQFNLENVTIDSIHAFPENYDLYFSPKLNNGEQRRLFFQGVEFLVSYEENEIESTHLSSDHSLTIEFDRDLQDNHIPLLFSKPEIKIQNIISEGNELHLFFKDRILENIEYTFRIEGLISCENKSMPHCVFNYIKDIQAPSLVDSKWKNRNQLLLEFSEAVNEQSLTSRLVLSQNEISIKGFTIEVDEQMIELTFENEYWNENMNLTIYEGLEDRYGNKTTAIIEKEQISIPAVSKGDVMITEIFADPTPSVGLPDSEALEIYNTSSDTLSLLGLNLMVGNDTLFFENNLIAPEAYSVLVPSTKVDLWSDYSSIISVRNWKALNNSGEIIRLYDTKNEELVDSVNYDLSNYQDDVKAEGGYTIEKRDLFFDCHPYINWTASVNDSGGTLGFQNSVFETIQDTIPAKIINIEVVDEHNMLITFDKSLYMFSTENAVRYSIDGVDKYVDKWHFVDNSTLNVLINEDLPTGVLITLIVDNFKDCFNNILLSGISNFIIKPKVNYQHLLVTELMIDHSPINKMPDSEYIEVYNNSDYYINLDRCRMLVDEDTLVLPDNWILPRNYAVLVPKGNQPLFDSLDIPSVGISGWKTLVNDNGKVELINEENEKIHTVNYTLEYYHDKIKEEGGWSIEMRDLMSPCVGVENWQASVNENGGTPAIKNSIEETVVDHHQPTLEYSLFIEDQHKVLLQFSEPIAFTDQTEISLDLESILKDEVELKGDQLLIYVPYDFSYAEVSISNITDCSGNLNSGVMYSEIVVPAHTENVFLSEILFDPSSINTDFLEVYFDTEKGSYINLKEWSIGRVKNDSIEQVVLLSKVDDYLFSSDLLVFTAEKEKLLDVYTKIKIENVKEINLPSFPNGNGNVVLMYKGEIQEVYEYSEKHHQSFLKNSEDISLERIAFDVSSSNANNWTSATESSGFATPTFMNSRIVNNTLNENFEAGLVFSPNLITTNGDGIDDYLKVENNSNSPLRILRMEIYDIHGKIIYEWLNNYELSSRDFVKWDGVDQSGRRVMGKFLVYYQLVDHHGNRQEQTKIVSVAPWN
ncbi:lamin tail domain-containing protein [Flammeovirga sp. SJP92]|uniref:lamin tail domain-containing protein n=1 Tax=Flammeovirga sp. SJP92 TaxID=1775430 RepID=UPI0007875682|nr:lamin tail domain-containing protein [Flammeovirga sp. SJP92]KXX68661.1 hypothetical protein AVL50_23160 [Flammeovirga sp. SJP92]